MVLRPHGRLYSFTRIHVALGLWTAIYPTRLVSSTLPMACGCSVASSIRLRLPTLGEKLKPWCCSMTTALSSRRD